MILPIPAPALDIAAMPVLCVDLDGTLVKSDTLHDSALAVARHHPAALLNIPGWLLQGSADRQSVVSDSQRRARPPAPPGCRRRA